MGTREVMRGKRWAHSKCQIHANYHTALSQEPLQPESRHMAPLCLRFLICQVIIRWKLPWVKVPRPVPL